MNSCTEWRRHSAWAAPLAFLILIAGCSSQSSKPAGAPAPTPVTAAAAATPAGGDAEQRFDAALKLMKDKKPKEAMDAFAALAKDFPQFSGPLSDLGVLYAQGKKNAQAFDAFKNAVTANPNNGFAYGWLGILYREAGDYGHAEECYLKAIALKPDDATAHLNLGILYDAYLHRPQDALTQYHEYQRIAGTDRVIVTAWINEMQDSLPKPAAPAPAAAPALTPGPTSSSVPAAAPVVAVPPAGPTPAAAPRPEAAAPVTNGSPSVEVFK